MTIGHCRWPDQQSDHVRLERRLSHIRERPPRNRIRRSARFVVQPQEIVVGVRVERTAKRWTDRRFRPRSVGAAVVRIIRAPDLRRDRRSL